MFDLALNGEVARVAALPFVSERRIVKVAELLESDPGQWLEKYQGGMRRLIQNLSSTFTNDTVNLLVMHGTMNGATLSNSEYTFHCTDTYALGADILPDRANYVALGHIHKPQAIQGYPENAGRYAGSILQLDFGEQGDAKHVYIVEARAGKPTELLKAVSLQSGKRLKRLNMELDDLDRRAHEFDFDGYLKLALKLERPRPGLKDRIRADFPNVLSIDIELPEVETSEEEVDLEGMDLLTAYARYYEEKRGQSVPDDVQDAFRDLLEDEEEVPEVVS